MSTAVQQRGPSQAPATLKSILDQPAYKARFAEILNKRAPQFMASIIQVGRGLDRCDPHTIISSALVAATLDLPISKELGFAWLIPYGSACQFQLGARGFIQLAQRSGQYENINVTEVYDGEVQNVNRLTGRFTLDGKKISEKVVGYAAYFRLINGFEKQEYWTLEEVKKHAERFSQGYKSGRGSPWQSDFDAMAMKTVLKHLLSHWGILSIELQSAVRFDSSVVKDEEGELTPEFKDNDERFQNAKVAKATVADPTDAPPGAEPPPATPAAAATPATPAAATPKSEPAKPAATAATSAPVASNGDAIPNIRRMMEEKGITEAELCKFATDRYKISPCETLEEILEIAPRRIALILQTFATIAAELRP